MSARSVTRVCIISYRPENYAINNLPSAQWDNAPDPKRSNRADPIYCGRTTAREWELGACMSKFSKPPDATWIYLFLLYFYRSDSRGQNGSFKPTQTMQGPEKVYCNAR